MSSVAYWYAMQPTATVPVPPVAKRLPVLRDNMGKWLHDPANQITSRTVPLNDEMKEMKARWAAGQKK